MTNSVAQAMNEAHITENEVLANEADGDTPVSETISVEFDIQADTGMASPTTFQAGIKTIANKLADSLETFVDKTFYSTWTDLFRVANLIELEFGILPGFHEAGRAWQAAQQPDLFAFDKDTQGYTEAHESEGVLKPMSWQEIQAKRAEGLRPMSNSQYQFLIETSERVLDGMAMLHTLRQLGYESQHTAEDVWTAAKEAEERRQKNYQDRQELESLRKKQASESALKEAVDNGSLIM